MNGLADLIQDYRNRFGHDEVSRRNYLSSISKEQLLIDLRNFGTVKIDGKARYFSHFKNNRWFNRKQSDKNGKVTQLRDEFIKRLRSSEVLSVNPKPTFDQVFNEVSQIYFDIQKNGIKGANQMTLYDIACFIGDHLEVYPDKVYVHQGVIKGARALGLILNNEETILQVEEIIQKVPELEVLKDDPDQIESFLCIHKDELAKLKTA